MGKYNFSFFSDHAALIFNIILKFYFSLFKIRSLSYKSHFIKLFLQFLTSSQFCLFLNNKIEIYGNTDHVMGIKLHFISNNLKGLQNSLKRVKTFEYLKKKTI